jgi:hypothetical protein
MRVGADVTGKAVVWEFGPRASEAVETVELIEMLVCGFRNSRDRAQMRAPLNDPFPLQKLAKEVA